MSKKTSGTARLLLKAAFGLLLFGAIGFLLLVGVYIALAKDSAEAAAAQAAAARGGVAPVHVAQREAVRQPTPAAQPRSASAGPGPVERFVPVQERTLQEVRDPKTGEVRLVPVTTTRYVHEIFTPATSQPTVADRRAVDLAAKIRGTEDDAERAKLREQLVETLDAAFNERRERQSEAIDQLEEQLQELRNLHEQRGERKEEIVQRRLNELLAEPDVLAWDPRSGIAGVPGKNPRTVERDDRVPSGALPGPGVFGEPRSVEREQFAPSELGQAAKDDPFGTSMPRSITKDDGISPSDVPGDDPFANRDPFSGDDPFGPTGPGRSADPKPDTFGRQPPRRTAEPASRVEKQVPSTDADAEVTAAVEALSSSESRAWGFGDLDRILELLAEISRLEAMEPLNAPSTRRALQLARAKLEIAELDYAQTGQQLRARVEEAEAQLRVAETRRKHIEALYKQGATPQAELHSVIADLRQAEAELQGAKLLLEGRQKADEILEKYRAMIDDAVQSSDTATTTANPEPQEPVPPIEQETEPLQDAETVER